MLFAMVYISLAMQVKSEHHSGHSPQSLKIGPTEDARLCPKGLDQACSFVVAVYGRSHWGNGSKYKLSMAKNQQITPLIEGLATPGR